MPRFSLFCSFSPLWGSGCTSACSTTRIRPLPAARQLRAARQAAEGVEPEEAEAEEAEAEEAEEAEAEEAEAEEAEEPEAEEAEAAEAEAAEGRQGPVGRSFLRDGRRLEARIR